MRQHCVLIIGVGSIGERHLRCFKATGRADLCFCETNESLRRTVADRYGVERHYATLDEALADRPRPFDLAVVATPAPLHVPMATQLAEAGVHPFIEKPLSINLDGIAELDELTRRKGLRTAVAFTHRNHGAQQDMKRAIDAGRFGKPVQLAATWGQHFPKYRPAYRETYYTSRAAGGGCIQDMLPHAINAAEWFVGPVDRVCADAAHLVLEGVELEDTVNVLARHGDVLASYSLNQHQAPNEHTTTVICEKGTARLELHNSRWLSMVEPGTEWREELVWSLERDDSFINQANMFLDVVEGRGEPTCTLREGLQSLRVTLAILRSVDRLGWVPVRDDGAPTS